MPLAASRIRKKPEEDVKRRGEITKTAHPSARNCVREFCLQQQNVKGVEEGEPHQKRK